MGGGRSHDIGQLLTAEKYSAVSIGGGDVTFEPPFRGIYVGLTGDVRTLSLDNEDETWENLAAGVIHPIAGKKIFQSGTTATGIKVVRPWQI